MCLEKYGRILEGIESDKCQVTDNTEFETTLLKDTFGRKGLYEDILEENGENLLKSINLNELNLPDIKELTLTLSPYVRRRLTLMRVSKLICI